MNRITTDKVCKKVYDRNWREIDPALRDGRAQVRYSLREFEGDMMADDFIASRVTVRNKWTALKAVGVIAESGKLAAINVETLREACGRLWDA